MLINNDLNFTLNDCDKKSGQKSIGMPHILMYSDIYFGYKKFLHVFSGLHVIFYKKNPGQILSQIISRLK